MSAATAPPGRTGIDRLRARGRVDTVEGAIATTAAAYATAERQVRDELSVLTDRIVSGRGGAATADQRRAVLRTVAERRAELDDAARLFADDSLARIYASGASRADRALGLSPGAGSFGTPHRRALEVLATDLADDLAAATSYLETSTKRAIREATRTGSIVRGATGDSIPNATRRLLDDYERRGVSAFVDRAGREWRLSSYAEMALRTKSASAYNTGTILRAREAGTDVFEILDGDRSGHDACVAYNRSTCTGAWAFAHPIEHPNCVRRFVPLPLHEGPVDHGDTSKRPGEQFTEDEAAAIAEHAAGGAGEDLLARMPQDRVFDHPGGFAIHNATMGPGKALVSRGTLHYVDDAALAASPFPDATSALRAIRKDVRAATPAGLGEPAVRQVVYTSATSPQGQFVRGSSSGADLAMWRRADVQSIGSDWLGTGTIVHEVGHSWSHLVNRRVAAVVDERRRQAEAGFLSRVQALPDDDLRPMIRDATDRVAASVGSAREVNLATVTLDDLFAVKGSVVQQRALDLASDGGRGGTLPWARAVGQADTEFERAVERFSSARESAMRAALRERGGSIDRFAGHGAQPGYGWVEAMDADTARLSDLRKRYDRVQREAETGSRGRTFVEGPFRRPVPSMSPKLREELRVTRFVEGSGPGHTHPVVTSGPVRWNPGDAPRSGVTPYGASNAQGIEDWAEGWRLFRLDQQKGNLGVDALTGKPVRFRDLFPNRDRYLRDLADVARLDLG